MPQKRKRNASLPPKGLPAGEKLDRNALPGNLHSLPWAWVGSEVTNVAGINLDHRMASCNLASRNKIVFCRNNYAVGGDMEEQKASAVAGGLAAIGELDEDVIVISDEDEPACSKKACKNNPRCLNHLGQRIWEDEGDALEEFIKAAELGENPLYSSREPGLPVGLKNLGATCYANASLQVWFRDLAFRSGVYNCELPGNILDEKYKDSPIFQLQVTFAALQESNQSVFNPTKLVESLQLRATEQQDAQEFSKLFMTHLDAEFKKQTSPTLKSLIAHQFQGTQVFGTICHSCDYRSERNSEFLEIEINFKNNDKLEDCISTSLLPETLSGDNQYFCSRCDSLQDASRYTELRQLPPVLHFSLLRFVYDLDAMDRKKSKHSISFPSVLDMRKFLGSKQDREATASTRIDECLYELRGILLHKGASAYHGHYEAQVFDAENESWFQFNDDTVTKIKALGDKAPPRKANGKHLDGEDEQPDTSEVRKKRANARKRRRVDDSDDGDDVIVVNRKPSPRAGMPDLIASRDAYMLIYAKKQPIHSSQYPASGSKSPASSSVPRPPDRALEVIKELNDAHEVTCKAYEEREKAAKASLIELKGKMKSIYKSWATTPSSDAIVVSRQALEAWSSIHCIKAALRFPGISLAEIPISDSSAKEGDRISISCSDIVCQHGSLDPKKSNDMKCITPDANEEIIRNTHCIFEPALKPSDACGLCVANMFQEKLYEIEHPRYMKQVDLISVVPDDEFDWRLLKPRMHVPCQDDPAPDSSEFLGHVCCEHGGLTLNTTNRRKISVEAVTLLQKAFPQWQPLSTDAEPCAICDADIHISKADKKELRKLVENEKARLKFIYEPSLDSWARRSEYTSYAMLSSQFIKSWKRWLHNSMENPRPDRIDNTPLLCQHDRLIIDPNCPTDLDSSVTVIQRDEWDVLNSIYDGGPLIALSKKLAEVGSVYDHEISVCEECRMRRKIDWDSADIVIRMHVPNGSSTTKPIQKAAATYGRINGARQSKRLRQIKEHGERRVIKVAKSSSVKDIKVMVQEEFSIPTICQRLFYQDKELEDNAATVESLQVFANDIIDVKEIEEVLEITSDSDEPPARKRRKEEGSGFGGTLLGNADVPWSSSPEQTPHPSDREKTCSACTFSNVLDALSCEICDTNFV